MKRQQKAVAASGDGEMKVEVQLKQWAVKRFETGHEAAEWIHDHPELEFYLHENEPSIAKVEGGFAVFYNDAAGGE